MRHRRLKRSPLPDLADLTVTELPGGGFQGGEFRCCDGGGHRTVVLTVRVEEMVISVRQDRFSGAEKKREATKVKKKSEFCI